MIDSHCHLADPKFAADLQDVLRRATAAGVHHAVTIADSIPEARRCVELAESHPELFCTVGVHPHHAKDWQEGDEQELERLVASSRRVKGIGEIGLDYHYDFSPREDQKRIFRTQLQLAKKLGLPAVIHNRESIQDLRAIIEEVQPPSFVLHCCTEKWEDVRWIVESGQLLSFTGIATYANAENIRETIRQCPLEQLMIETDAPYLAPVPHRGKRNEPAYVVEVAKLIAEVKGVGFDEIDAQTTHSAQRFFGLPV